MGKDMSLKRGRKHYMETTPNFLLCSYISLRTKNVLADYFQQNFYHLGICQKFRKQLYLDFSLFSSTHFMLFWISLKLVISVC